MLDGLRTASKSWFGKAILTVVFGLIIVSFAIWGIGDMFRGFGQGRLAAVGDTEISAESFRFAYQNELQRLQRRFGRVVTNDQARQAGLDRQVLGRLVTEAALDQKARRLGLAMSDADVAKSIMTDPTFKGPDGAFDKGRFDSILRDNGYNERTFVREQRAVYLRQELADALIAKIEAPQLVVESIDRYRNETRSVEYFVLPASSVAAPPEPDPATLQKFYDDRKAAFAAPEYRKITALTLTPATAARPEDVPEADARKLYETVKAQRFGSPERRNVQQIVYPNEAEAQAAADKIRNGATFETLIADRKLNDKDVDLGLVTKKQIADAAIADTAFALKEGVVSGPTKGAFGVALLRVTRIEPESVKPFADVAGELRKEIAQERARKSVQELHDKVEDQRAGGKPLSEAAKAAGLTARTIEAVDAQGRDKNGAAVEGVAGDADLLRAIFASDVGVDNEAIATRDNGYKWFEISAVEPARQKTLEEARVPVLVAWRLQETQRLLTQKTADIVKRLRAGEKFDEIAKAEKAEVKHSPDVKRIGAEGFDEAAVVQIFDQPNGGFGSVATPAGRMVFHVLDSATPDFNPDKDVNKQIAEQMKSQIGEDILGEYVKRLEKDYGVRLNEAVFRAAVGGQEQ